MNVENIIARFGGVKRLAGILGSPVTTVQNWLARKRIPQKRWEQLMLAGQRHGIQIDRDDFFPTPQFERAGRGNV